MGTSVRSQNIARYQAFGVNALPGQADCVGIGEDHSLTNFHSPTYTNNSVTSTMSTAVDSKRQTRRWSREEHDKFLRGLEMFPHGPWSRIAAVVGTRTTRQTMTHAQKYRERIARRADEVQELMGNLGHSSAHASFARLQETIRELPTLTQSVSSAQLSSSDEDLMEEIGLGGVPAELDDLDMRILLSLVNSDSVEHVNFEPLSAGESQELDHSIWSLLIDMPGDLTSLPDDL